MLVCAPRVVPWLEARLGGWSLHIHYTLLTAVIRLKQSKANEICRVHHGVEGIINAKSKVTDDEAVERLWRVD